MSQRFGNLGECAFDEACRLAAGPSRHLDDSRARPFRWENSRFLLLPFPNTCHRPMILNTNCVVLTWLCTLVAFPRPTPSIVPSKIGIHTLRAPDPIKGAVRQPKPFGRPTAGGTQPTDLDSEGIAEPFQGLGPLRYAFRHRLAVVSRSVVGTNPGSLTSRVLQPVVSLQTQPASKDRAGSYEHGDNGGMGGNACLTANRSPSLPRLRPHDWTWPASSDVLLAGLGWTSGSVFPTFHVQ